MKWLTPNPVAFPKDTFERKVKRVVIKKLHTKLTIYPTVYATLNHTPPLCIICIR